MLLIEAPRRFCASASARNASRRRSSWRQARPHRRPCGAAPRTWDQSRPRGPSRRSCNRANRRRRRQPEPPKPRALATSTYHTKQIPKTTAAQHTSAHEKQLAATGFNDPIFSTTRPPTRTRHLRPSRGRGTQPLPERAVVSQVFRWRTDREFAPTTTNNQDNRQPMYLPCNQLAVAVNQLAPPAVAANQLALALAVAVASAPKMLRLKDFSQHFLSSSLD
jgi:hypothetical protein